MAGIYIHIPFCKQACHYCNFYFTTSKKWYNEAVDAISKELILRKKYLKEEPIETIYFGGGTPTLLNEFQLGTIFNTIYKHFKISDSTEITIEANPDDLSLEYIKTLKDSPLNRLSIGVQSFYEEDLVWMNRAHNSSEATACIKIAQDAGFDNLNVDMIFGVPTSNMEKWQSNLSQCIEMNIPHLACYALTVEPNTALHTRIQKNLDKGPEDKATIDQFYYTHDYLKINGFEHYEVSNYAIPGKHARHNSNYWNNVPYLGVGPSAHSFNGHSRSWNISHIHKYIKAIEEGTSFRNKEDLEITDKYNEFVMISLRQQTGLNVEKLKNEYSNYSQYFTDQLKTIDKDLLIIEEDIIRLSRKGMAFSDQVASNLFFV